MIRAPIAILNRRARPIKRHTPFLLGTPSITAVARGMRPMTRRTVRNALVIAGMDLGALNDPPSKGAIHGARRT